MNTFVLLFLVLIAMSCKPAGKENVIQEVSEPVNKLIIAERIDGPANIRDAPNGEVLFELYNDVLVEATQPKEDWFQVLVYADIKYEEYGLDSITKGRYIISEKDTIGRILKTLPVNTMQGKNNAYAIIQGFTHKNNIKPETIIENALQKKLAKGSRYFDNWAAFIHNFKLSPGAVDYKKFDTYYTYENTIDDPSPGFRIVLLFNDSKLVGFVHARELNIEDMKTHKLEWSYFISFFNDFPIKEQLEFVSYMNGSKVLIKSLRCSTQPIASTV